MKQDFELKCLVGGGLVLAAIGLAVTGCVQMPGEPSRQATANYAQGVIAYNEGNMPVAKEKLGAATQESPELIKARTLLGDLFRAEGDYRAALAEYETVVKLDPYSSTGFYRLGLAYQFLQRFLEARDAYETAIKLKPSDAEAHMNVGLVYLALGDLPKAMEHSKQATELLPENGNALANYGVVLDAVGDKVGAEKALVKSLEISGDNPATLLNLGQNLLSQNRPAEAQEVLVRLLAKTESAIGVKRLGDAYALQGQAGKAIEQYEKAIRLDGAYFPAYNDAGRVMIQRYRAGAELEEPLRETAISYWKRSLKINGRQPQIEALVKQWEKSKP